VVENELLPEIIKVELLDINKSNKEIRVDDGFAFRVLVCREDVAKSIASIAVVDLKVQVPETFEFGKQLEVELVKTIQSIGKSTSRSASELPVKSFRFSMVRLVMLELPML
jgi:hypothetical protein